MASVQTLVVCVTLSQSIASATEPHVPAPLKFRIARDGGVISLPVDAGSSRRLFVFDTGSNMSAFDASLRPLLGGETRRRTFFTPNGSQRTSAFVPPSMSIGSRHLQTAPEVLCLNLGGVRQYSGQPVFGVLGMDAIRTMIVRLDFDSGELWVLPSLPRDVGEPLELLGDRGIPCVGVRAGAKPHVLFSIDTGASGTGSGDLESGLFNALFEAGTLSVVGEVNATTIAGTTRERIGRIAELGIGSNRHSHLIFQESSRSALSLGFLSRYIVVFDFPNMRMYLSPGRRFNDPDRHDLSGLHLLRTDGKTIVESLDDQSSAKRAGLHTGDVLLSVDKTAVDSLAMLELRRMLGTPSTRLLTIRRGEATLRRTLELREKRATNDTTPRVQTTRKKSFFQKLVPSEQLK